jgi:hypothetical protein
MTSDKVYERYEVSSEELRTFHERGWLVVPGLVDAEDVDELRRHTEDLMYGRVRVDGLEPPSPGLSPLEIAQRYLRIHMLHRKLEIHERYLLHPRILDVLECLIGPDVMAMQTMLFIKGPSQPGQGYHQDSYYIKVHPDTLCGAWLAVDDADEENGALYFVPGSQFDDIHADVGTPADTTNHQAGLIEIKDVVREREVLVAAKAGDVVFFGGHVIHRSTQNRSAGRLRRAFVGHYGNARSVTQWGGGNANMILARGTTDLPFARPVFSDYGSMA